MNPQKTTGVILAAGLGSRLLAHTATIPKAMQDLHGETIIRRAIAWMRYLGIVRIVVVTGYLHDKLEQHIAGFDSNVITVVNNEYANTQRMVSLLRAEEYIQGALLVQDGDYFYHRDIADEVLRTNYDLVTVHATSKQSTYCVQDVIAKTDASLNLLDLHKTVGTAHLQAQEYYFNSMLFCPVDQVQAFLTVGKEIVNELGYGKVHIEDAVLAYAKQRDPVNVHVFDEPKWVEIDTPEELEAARRFILDYPSSVI